MGVELLQDDSYRGRDALRNLNRPTTRTGRQLRFIDVFDDPCDTLGAGTLQLHGGWRQLLKCVEQFFRVDHAQQFFNDFSVSAIAANDQSIDARVSDYFDPLKYVYRWRTGRTITGFKQVG